SDRRALNADAVTLDGFGGFDGDLVVRLIAVLDAEVVVVQVHVEVGQDELLLDHLPDDSSHLIAVEFYDGAFDLDLGHGSPVPPTHDGRLVGNRADNFSEYVSGHITRTGWRVNCHVSLLVSSPFASQRGATRPPWFDSRTRSASALRALQRRIEGLARPHHRCGLFPVRVVIAPDVHWGALHL